MLQRMRSVRDSLLSPQVVLRVDLPLDVYIDRSLDGTSNNNGTDNDGIRFRGQIMSNEESMMQVDLQRVPSLTPTHNVHSLEEVNEVLINSSFEQLQNTENRQGNLLLKFSCFRHYIIINHLGFLYNLKHIGTIPQPQELHHSQDVQYILDDNDPNFPSYRVLRGEGTLSAGNEESETVALLNAVASNLPVRIERSADPLNEHECFAKILLGAFPYLFITGTGLPLVGGISKKLIKHMLLQGDGRFGRCSNFIYTLFNYEMRKKASIGASLQIKRHPKKMQEFADFIRDPETPQNILNAIIQQIQRLR